MNQGEIWLINLDPAIGAETNKTRPAVIVNTNALAKHPLKVIVPVADWSERFSEVPWMVKIAPDQKNGLIDQSAIDCFQMRSLSEDRFVAKLGEVEAGILELIKIALSKVLSIQP